MSRKCAATAVWLVCALGTCTQTHGFSFESAFNLQGVRPSRQLCTFEALCRGPSLKVTTTNRDRLLDRPKTTRGGAMDGNNFLSTLRAEGGGAEVETGFDWAAQWYPAIPERDLEESWPNKLTLLGKDFVVWRHKPTARWRCLSDECPHRLVPLSEGRVEANGNIQCAYHGWEFDADGSCVRIPQLGKGLCEDSPAVRSARACATSYPCRVWQGLVWIFPTADEQLANATSPPLIPELDDPSFVDATNFFVRDVPYSWDILVENLCDPAHIPFAHHALMNNADRTAALDIDIKVTSQCPTGFRAQQDPYPENGGRYDITFKAPALIYYEIAGGGTQSFLGLGQYCVPTAPGRSRVITRFPFRLPSAFAMAAIRKTPRWITHFSQNAVIDSDVCFLTAQDRRHAAAEHGEGAAGGYYMPARSDSMVTAFRGWVAAHGGGAPGWVGDAESALEARTGGERRGWARPRRVPGRQGRDALLDRYRQHTDICRDCREAHAAVLRVREGLLGVGLLMLAASTVGVPGVGVGGWGVGVGWGGAVLVAVSRWLLEPLLARMEVAPWPRGAWAKPTEEAALQGRAR